MGRRWYVAFLSNAWSEELVFTGEKMSCNDSAAYIGRLVLFLQF